MKPTSGIVVVIALGASLLAGCGAAETEGEGADYPPTGPTMGVEPRAQAASATAPGAAREEEPPPPETVGSTSEEEAEAAQEQQMQPGDVQVGGDGGEYADTDPSALQDFRPALDPYGSWVDDPTYGTIWTPSPGVVGDDFAPYVSGGHWAYDDDWTWVSDYDWGWAPFHYGRWVYATNRWGWIPGRQYSGAWVTWRTGYEGYGYLGWAPLPPTWYWHGGYAVGLGYVPRAPYVFCGYHDVFYHGNGGLGARLVSGPQVAGVASHTRPYSPASPTIGGAAGSVASGGRIAAHPTVGPSPGGLGISATEVNHAATNDRVLMHASQFARPSTAQALGAHAPSGYASRSATGSVTPNAFGVRSYADTSRGSAAFGAYARNAPVASSPRYNGVAPSTGYRPSYGGYQRYGSSYPSYGSQQHYGSFGGQYGSRTFSGTPSYRGGGNPAFHGGATTTQSHAPEPSYGSAPSRGGGASRGGGGFRGGGGGGGGYAGGGRR